MLLFAESLRSRYTAVDLAHKPHSDFGTRILVFATTLGGSSLCICDSFSDSCLAWRRHCGRVHDGWKSGHWTE